MFRIPCVMKVKYETTFHKKRRMQANVYEERDSHHWIVKCLATNHSTTKEKETATEKDIARLKGEKITSLYSNTVHIPFQ